jgi:hypothetical protein
MSQFDQNSTEEDLLVMSPARLIGIITDLRYDLKDYQVAEGCPSVDAVMDKVEGYARAIADSYPADASPDCATGTVKNAYKDVRAAVTGIVTRSARNLGELRAGGNVGGAGETIRPNRHRQRGYEILDRLRNNRSRSMQTPSDDKPNPFDGIMPTNPLEAAAWCGCLSWAIGKPEVIAAYRAETGDNWEPGNSGIERIIDTATGRDVAFLRSFAEWMTKNVWGEDGEGDTE